MWKIVICIFKMEILRVLGRSLKEKKCLLIRCLGRWIIEFRKKWNIKKNKGSPMLSKKLT